MVHQQDAADARGLELALATLERLVEGRTGRALLLSVLLRPASRST